MSNDEAVRAITFDVKDMLYFKNGQGISEMVAISLDPDILVQSYDSYIQIRGLILLQGEYERNLDSNKDRDTELTTVEKVIDTENNYALFTHRFPVDISVASERVKDVNDLLVTVYAFDYELLDSQILKIMAEVKIDGIDTEMAEVKSNESLFPLADSEDLEEVNTLEEKTEAVASNEGLEIEEVVTASTEAVEEKIATEEVEVTKNVEPESVAGDIEEESLVVSTEVSDATIQAEEAEEAEEQDDENMAIQLNESDTDEDTRDVNDVQFLTELFGTQDEEAQTKMRLYIIQSDDTIESIATQYEVSTLQLIKDNNLSNEILAEGQLLQIPIK